MIDEKGLLRIYLIQRLTKPQPDSASRHSFGGGLLNGGISDPMMAILRPIFTFDYMGAAEFEHGEVPRTLALLGRASEECSLVSGKISLCSNRGTWVKQSIQNRIIDSKTGLFYFKESRLTKKEIARRAALPRFRTVYFICRREIQSQVKVFLRAISKYTFYRKGYRLKESPQLDVILGNSYREPPEGDRTVQGWMALGEPFLFFIDETMFRKMARLLKVPVQDTIKK